MHAVDRPVGVAVREELLALDSACYDVANEWVLLWQICCEVHLLPFELLANAQPRKAKVRADGLSFHEVKKTV